MSHKTEKRKDSEFNFESTLILKPKTWKKKTNKSAVHVNKEQAKLVK